MAKRRTIGENPLDAVAPGSPLDVVVPDPRTAGRARAEEELKERLAQVGKETEARLAQAAKECEARVSQAARETKEALGRLEAELMALKGEVAGLRAELARLQVKAPPGDLPFWMRGSSR